MKTEIQKAWLVPLTDFGDGLEPNEVLAMRLPEGINAILVLRGLDGRADWYYDEDVWPIEHGIKITISGLTAEWFEWHIDSIAELCEQHCERVEVTFDE